MMDMSVQRMVDNGELTKYEGVHYITDDGRIIRRVYTSHKMTTTKWWVEGENHVHRNLYEAYIDSWQEKMPKGMMIAPYV